MTNKKNFNSKLLDGLEDKEYWEQILKELNRVLANAERRDRYHNTIHVDYASGETDPLSKKNYTFTSNENDSPEQILIRHEQSEFLYTLLENLDEEDRIIIIGLYSESKTLKQLGNELEISPVAVRKRKLKIIKKMQQNFSDFYDNAS